MKSTTSTLAFSFCLALASTTLAAEFHVAPGGDDGNPGTSEKPFATYARARTAVRTARAARPEASVTVTFQPGRYELKAPLTFEPADSGPSADHPVVYRAAPGGEVEISGGRVLAGWRRDPDRPGVWKTRAHQSQAGEDGRFDQLWVNGIRAVRARTPNSREFHSLLGVEEEPPPDVRKRCRHIFNAEPSDLETLKLLDKTDLKNVQILVYHKWDTTREFLESVSPEDGEFVTRGSPMKAWNKMCRDCLYFFENYLGALDAPGEWFLDRDGWVYYKPRKGEDMATARVVAPRIESLLEIRGETGDPERRVRHLRFEGLKFRHSGLRIPGGGFPPRQAGMIAENAAVLADGAGDIRFDRCAVEHVGGTAFWFREACHDCRVERTRMCDLGVSGVRIGLMKYVPEPDCTARITIHNCIIQSGGRVLPCAVGVWIGHSPDNAITHCNVADFYYTAVSVGWRWGYAQSAAKRNTIAFNHLHHIGYRILSDMGGVYTLGPSEGTRVSHNVIHDIDSTRYGGWGLYPDEGSTGIRFEGNLVYDVRDGTFHQHYGRENLVRNNILAFSKEGQIAVTRSEPHRSFTFENNIVTWDEGGLLGSNGWKAGARVGMRNNLYWRTRGREFDFAGMPFDEWRATGKDEGSLIADPLFVNPEARDFRLRPGSPALQAGFKPFDFSRAGVTGDDAWKKLAAATVFPESYVVPPLLPLTVEDDFERSTRASLLKLVTLDNEGRTDLVKVTEKVVAASGKRCLEVRRHPGLKQGFNPHFHWDPRLAAGKARLAFKLRLEPGAALLCEWRGKGHPYKVGPSLMFRGGHISTGGNKLMPVPNSQWIGVVMETSPGEPGGTWTASFQMPDGKKKKFSGLPCDPEWKETRWLGFCSIGSKESVLYLDDVALRLD